MPPLNKLNLTIENEFTTIFAEKRQKIYLIFLIKR